MSFSRRKVLALIGLAPVAAIASKVPAGAELPVHVTDVMPEPWLGGSHGPPSSTDYFPPHHG